MRGPGAIPAFCLPTSVEHPHAKVEPHKTKKGFTKRILKNGKEAG